MLRFTRSFDSVAFGSLTQDDRKGKYEKNLAAEKGEKKKKTRIFKKDEYSRREKSIEKKEK